VNKPPNPVLSDRQAREILRRQRREPPPKVAEPTPVTAEFSKELAQLRALIQKHGSDGRYEQIRATRNFFAAMLHLNHPANRKLNPGRVQWWRDAAAEGRWFDLDPFYFSSDGFMLDGQHRAKAFGEADLTMDVWIKFGVDPASFAAMDIGMPRSPAQNLKLRGFRNAGTLSSIVRFKHRIAHGGVIPDPHLVEVSGERLATEHGELLVRAMVSSQKLYRTFQTPQSAAAWAYCLIVLNSSRGLSVDEFWDRLHPTESYGLEQGSAIAVLRQKLRRERGQAKARGQYLYQTQQAAWIIKAWNAWTRGTRPVLTWTKVNELPAIDAKE